MITEDCVSLGQAKLLKEKGFDEECMLCYTLDIRHNGISISFNEECELRDNGKWDEIERVDGGRISEFLNKNSTNYDSSYSMPHRYDVLKWLRKKHNIHINVSERYSFNSDNDINYTFWVHHYKIEEDKVPFTYKDGEFMSYEEAESAAIDYVLTNLIENDRS